MAKCRGLLEENEQLAGQVRSGRVAELEAEVALQKELISELNKNHHGGWPLEMVVCWNGGLLEWWFVGMVACWNGGLLEWWFVERVVCWNGDGGG